MVRGTSSVAVFILAVAIMMGVAACNLGNTQLSVSGIPNVPGQLAFRAVGTVGTPFTAILSDARSSWRVQGTVPTTFAIVNPQLPARMIATKTVSNTNLLSLEVISGFYAQSLASSSQPYGIVQVQYGGTLTTFQPRAEPDVRFVLRAPQIALVTGNIEDLHTSFTIEQRVPTIFLFDSPQGRVDGIFNLNNLGAGSMTIQLLYTSGPNPTNLCQKTSSTGQITIRYPGCTATQLASKNGLSGAEQFDLNAPD